MVRAVWTGLVCLFLVYTVYVYYNADERVNEPGINAKQGWNTWQEKNCQACHQLYGLGGYLGPDLTNCYSQKGPSYMRGIIEHGTANMPSAHLSEAELKNILAFLKWVDKSGKSIVEDSSVHWTGTYIISRNEQH